MSVIPTCWTSLVIDRVKIAQIAQIAQCSVLGATCSACAPTTELEVDTLCQRINLERATDATS